CLPAIPFQKALSLSLSKIFSSFSDLRIALSLSPTPNLLFILSHLSLPFLFFFCSLFTHSPALLIFSSSFLSFISNGGLFCRGCVILSNEGGDSIEVVVIQCSRGVFLSL
ncbi:unnamed protein product, partial [Prunus brigantina]